MPPSFRLFLPPSLPPLLCLPPAPPPSFPPSLSHLARRRQFCFFFKAGPFSLYILWLAARNDFPPHAPREDFGRLGRPGQPCGGPSRRRARRAATHFEPAAPWGTNWLGGPSSAAEAALGDSAKMSDPASRASSGPCNSATGLQVTRPRPQRGAAAARTRPPATVLRPSDTRLPRPVTGRPRAVPPRVTGRVTGGVIIGGFGRIGVTGGGGRRRWAGRRASSIRVPGGLGLPTTDSEPAGGAAHG